MTELSTSDVRIEGASGQRISYLGVLLISLTVLNIHYRDVPVFVVPTDDYRRRVPVLIGTNVIRASKRDQQQIRGDDFMKQCGDENLAWHTAYMNTANCEKEELSGRLGYVKYLGPHRTTVPAGKEVEVIGQAPPNPTGQTYTAVVEGLPSSASCLRIAHIVTDVTRNRKVTVRVCNTSTRPITLHRNSKLAELSQVIHVDHDCPKPIATTEGSVQLDMPENTPNKVPALNLSSSTIKDEFERQQLDDLLLKYSDIFSVNPQDFGHTSTVRHSIPLIDKQPFRLPYRRIPPALYESVKDELARMEKSKVIRRSCSPYASPIVVAHKKDGSIRLCIDYRQLNSRTVRDAFPLPRIEESLDALGNASLFSTLDLTSGYWQVEMEEQDKHKTAFSTPTGLFECNRMPFGLQNAPATFQRLMSTCLRDLNLSTCLLYLDDIIVFSSSFEEHIQRLDKVFACLKQHGLKLKPSKCSLLQQKVKYLGHIVSAEGIATDPDKVLQVQNWQRPSTRKELLRFLGFTGYCRRFIKGYSNIVAPLYQLTSGDPRRNKKGKRKTSQPTPPFIWTAECEEAFRTLKTLMTTAPILAYADYSQPFILQIDASGTGLGAVLSQLQKGKERIIAYASRGLSSCEKRYPAHKLEFLSLKWAMTDKLRDYLLGAQTTVLTDNNPLLYVTTSAKLDATGQRWVAALSQFNFSVKYKPGKDNAAADALSRKYSQDSTMTSIDPNIETKKVPADVVKAICECHQQESFFFIEPMALQCQAATRQSAKTDHPAGSTNLPNIPHKELAIAQRDDLNIGRVILYMERGKRPTHTEKLREPPDCLPYFRQWEKLCIKDDILYRMRKSQDGKPSLQLMLPAQYRDIALTALHNDMGHMGLDRTLDMVRARFFWPKMADDVKRWCDKCKRCCLRKTSETKTRVPLVSIVTSEPMELLCIDYLKLERSKGGYENILVVTDHFTKYAQAYPTRDQKAETVAKVLWADVIQHYGFPQRIHADQGRNFESKLIAEICKVAGIKKSRTTPYHPQGNGQTERFNHTLLSMLGTLEEQQKKNWKEHVSSMTHAYNSTKHETTGYAPFYLMFGRHANLPIDLMFGLGTSDLRQPTYEEFAIDLRDRLQYAYKTASEAARLAKSKQKRLYDRGTKEAPLQLGDRVLVQNKHIVGTQKLRDRWEPYPYVVISKQPDLPVYTVRSTHNAKDRILHRNLLTPCMFLPPDENGSIPEERQSTDETMEDKVIGASPPTPDDTIQRDENTTSEDSEEETNIVFVPVAIQLPREHTTSQVLSPSRPSSTPVHVSSDTTTSLRTNSENTNTQEESHWSASISDDVSISQPEPPPKSPIADVVESQNTGRPKRIRKPVVRFTYDFLGQTKLHRAIPTKEDTYRSRLEAGRKIFNNWNSPEMSATRKKVYLQLAGKETVI